MIYKCYLDECFELCNGDYPYICSQHMEEMMAWFAKEKLEWTDSNMLKWIHATETRDYSFWLFRVRLNFLKKKFVKVILTLPLFNYINGNVCKESCLSKLSKRMKSSKT